MSASCICLADCIGNACASTHGVGRIHVCECQLIVHHDVSIRNCSSLPVQSKQLNLIRVPTPCQLDAHAGPAPPVRMPYLVPLESSMQAAHFVAKLNVLARK